LRRTARCSLVWEIRRNTGSESDFLLPVGQPFLRKKHQAHRGFEPNDMDLSAPRNDEGAPERLLRLTVNDSHAKRLRKP